MPGWQADSAGPQTDAFGIDQTNAACTDYRTACIGTVCGGNAISDKAGFSKLNAACH
jgi:hypothetical protein